MAEEACESVGMTCGMYLLDHNTPAGNCHVAKNWLYQQEITADVDVVLLGDQDMLPENLDEPADACSENNTNVCNPVQYLLKVYRQANLADNDRQTILTHHDQLVAIQLCMAQYNKQKFDDFDVDTSEVLQFLRELHNHKFNPSSSSPTATVTQSTFDSVLELYRTMCGTCNVLDILDVFNRVKAWLNDVSEDADVRKKCLYGVLQWPKNELEVEILKLLTTSTHLYVMHVEGTATDGKTQVTCERNSVDVLTPKSCQPTTAPSATSATEVLARQLFLSYLTLLVNSRDEICIARCLSLTTDDLNHDGFIALKNESRAKNMPMFQTAVSYVIQIRLGGKSYRPKADSLLAPHVKGLSDFVTAVQKLQTIVEEEPDTRTAVVKVTSSFRGSLSKCKSQTLRKSSVVAVAERLKKEMDDLMGVWKGPLVESPPRKIDGGQGRIVFGLRTIRLLQGILDREVGRVLTSNPTQVLTDGFASQTQKTPVRIPSLLSQFRSPEVIDPTSPEYQTLRSRLFSPKDASTTPAGPKKWQSDLTWAKPAVSTGLDNQDDIEIFISPAQRQQKPRSKGNSLWAVSPEGRRSHPRLVSPNSEAFSTTGTGLSSNCQSVRSNFDSSDTPKKGKSKTAARNIPDASTLDQENLVNKLGAPVVDSKSKKRKAKRTLGNDGESSSQASKKAKKSSKVAKKKVIPLGKGQKTLSHFFRV